MKIVFLSDTHGKHPQLDLPAGDMIIHAGDISNIGRIGEVQLFLDWYQSLDYEYKIFIVGNHDFLAEKDPHLFRSMIPDNLIYLENTGVHIEGIHIWGSPISPTFFNWAFNRDRGAPINQYWNMIPNDVDILITHGPPMGILDQIYSGEPVGCADLKKRVAAIQPKIHVFGHIHEAYGTHHEHDTHFINASVLDLKYVVKNEIIVVDY